MLFIHSRTDSGADGCVTSLKTERGIVIGPSTAGRRSARPIAVKYRSGEQFDTAGIAYRGRSEKLFNC